MPETNVLYSVTAAVVVGLVAWVAVVLKSAKEPWAREVPAVPAERVGTDDVPVEGAAAGEAATADAKITPDAEPKAEAEAEPEAKSDAAKGS